MVGVALIASWFVAVVFTPHLGVVLLEPARSAFDIAILCLALAVPSAIAFGLDARTINDVNIWSKPLKFQLSFALHWLTVAWLLRQFSSPAASAPSLRWWLRIGALASVVEVRAAQVCGWVRCWVSSSAAS